MSNTPDLFSNAPLGRLAYWQEKATLCGKLSAEQARHGDTKNAIANAIRMTQALTQAELLLKEIGK